MKPSIDNRYIKIPIPPPTGYRRHPKQIYKVFSVRKSTHDKLLEAKEAVRKATGQKWPHWRVIQYGLELVLWAIQQNNGKLPLHRPKKMSGAYLDKLINEKEAS